jgi:uncharacterized protein
MSLLKVVSGWFARKRPQFETFAAALAGIALFVVVGLPTPVLSGAMVGVAALIAFGRSARLSPFLRDFGLLIGGVTMGSAVTPEMLQGLQRYPFSLLILFAVLGIGMLLSQWYFRAIAGWDRETAFFASVPGALSAVLAIAADTKADLLKVTMAQSVRLFVLLAVLPSLVAFNGSVGERLPERLIAPLPLAAVLVSGIALSLVFRRMRSAAPWLFGGMVASAFLHGSGLVVGDVPIPLMQIGFGLVGMYIGTRFSTLTRGLFLNLLAISLGSVAIGLAVTVAGALFAEAVLPNVTFGQALVAFAPGALEAMIILGVALGLDPIYVGLHHIVRFFGLAFAMRAMASLVSRDD